MPVLATLGAALAAKAAGALAAKGAAAAAAKGATAAAAKGAGAAAAKGAAAKGAGAALQKPAVQAGLSLLQNKQEDQEQPQQGNTIPGLPTATWDQFDMLAKGRGMKY